VNLASIRYMRRCNKCDRKLPNSAFKHKDKKTCLRCEFKWKIRVRRFIVGQRALSPYERMASRVGYMGAGFLIAAQWTLEPILYIIGFCCVIVQTSSRKQWNLVALNINGLIAWVRHLIS